MTEPSGMPLDGRTVVAALVDDGLALMGVSELRCPRQSMYS